MLPNLKVAAPCPADWNRMSGDARVRHCSLCNLNVYNLSAMTEPEVHKLLIEREGRLCVRMYQRTDGTLLTEDCPVGLRARVRQWKRVAMVALSAILSAPSLRAQSTTSDQLVQIRPGQTGVMITVVDAAGAVVPGADIQILSHGKVAFVGKTNANGSLISSGLSPDEYTVTITSPGFNTHNQKVDVKAGQLSKVITTLDIGGILMGVVVEVDPTIRDDSQQLETNIPVKSLPSGPVPESRRAKSSNR